MQIMEFRIHVYVPRISILSGVSFTNKSMTSRTKQKYSPIYEQEDLLQRFYNKCGHDEEVFLGLGVIDNDDHDNHFEFSSASADNESDEISKVTVSDAPELEYEEEMEERDKVYEDPTELLGKQQFKYFDVTLNEDNYTSLPLQKNYEFQYSDTNKTVNVTWNIISLQNVHRRTAGNINKHVPDPTGVVKYVKTPVEAFTLFLKSALSRT